MRPSDYYTRAIALIDRPEEKHWTFYYSRGTCYERVKKLSLAEADLQKALQLSPNQALTLNYLGYTWIDHNRNLQQGLGLIEKAVRLKPDDGYIVDSLGWAYYRLGNFKEAVKHLERAVELRPEDATLNDHLGDAYWRVEARARSPVPVGAGPEPASRSPTRPRRSGASWSGGCPRRPGASIEAQQAGAASGAGQEAHRGQSRAPRSSSDGGGCARRRVVALADDRHPSRCRAPPCRSVNSPTPRST